MKRRMGKGKKSKSVDMTGKSNEPFAKKAKKPEPDDKPHMPVGKPSANKNVPSARMKRLAGVKI